eukprot:scaffold95629_cov48-Prasinocladus_malaysianus.AAC.2
MLGDGMTEILLSTDLKHLAGPSGVDKNFKAISPGRQRQVWGGWLGDLVRRVRITAVWWRGAAGGLSLHKQMPAGRSGRLLPQGSQAPASLRLLLEHILLRHAAGPSPSLMPTMWQRTWRLTASRCVKSLSSPMVETSSKEPAGDNTMSLAVLARHAVKYDVLSLDYNHSGSHLAVVGLRDVQVWSMKENGQVSDRLPLQLPLNPNGYNDAGLLDVV